MNRFKTLNIRNIFAAMALAGTMFAGSVSVFADEPIYVEPLFEYPVAPEEIDGLQPKSDYLMAHFWDGMDFSADRAVDQNALNDAFNTYASMMPYASREAVMASVANLVKSIKPLSTLTLQFTKAAEEAFYGPRASFWSDEVYIPFLKNITSNKKISEARRLRYANQLNLLEHSAAGAKFPSLRLTLRDGRHKDFVPEKELTLIEFGNPDCDDCRFAKMKLTMASDIEDMLEAGELDILFVVADAVPEDQPEILEQFKEYPENWIPGISYGADDKLDLRSTPSFYIIDKKGRIKSKAFNVIDAVDNLRELAAQNASRDKGGSKKK